MLEMHGEHPLLASLQADTVGKSWQPRRLSDVISDLDLYRTSAFQVGLAPLGVNRQLMLFTAGGVPDLFHCWSMNCWNHDFSDNEVELAQQIQPMLQLLDAAYASTGHWMVEMEMAAA
jgi:hypothetical protein